MSTILVTLARRSALWNVPVAHVGSQSLYNYCRKSHLLVFNALTRIVALSSLLTDPISISKQQKPTAETCEPCANKQPLNPRFGSELPTPLLGVGHEEMPRIVPTGPSLHREAVHVELLRMTGSIPCPVVPQLSQAGLSVFSAAFIAR